MALIATPRLFHQKFKFLVELDSFGSAGFQTCSELSGEFAEIAYYEGGAVIPDKQPGRMTFADVTLGRGATLDRDIYAWFQQTGVAAANIGTPSPLFKRAGDIRQLDRSGITLRRWRLHGIWCKKFVAGAWDNNADENVMEQVTLAYDYFELDQ